MGKTFIHIQKAKFRIGFDIGLKYELHCKRHNAEIKYFAPLRAEKISKTFDKLNNFAE